MKQFCVTSVYLISQTNLSSRVCSMADTSRSTTPGECSPSFLSYCSLRVSIIVVFQKTFMTPFLYVLDTKGVTRWGVKVSAGGWGLVTLNRDAVTSTIHLQSYDSCEVLLHHQMVMVMMIIIWWVSIPLIIVILIIKKFCVRNIFSYKLHHLRITL